MALACDTANAKDEHAGLPASLTKSNCYLTCRTLVRSTNWDDFSNGLSMAFCTMPLRECGMNKFCFPFNLHAVHIFGNCTVLSTNLRQQWVDDNQQPAPNPLFALLQIDASATQAAIGSSGEVDRYLFNVASANRLVVETTALSDTVMYIAGPNNPRRLHSSNDDGGQNFKCACRHAVYPMNLLCLRCILRSQRNRKLRDFRLLMIQPCSSWVGVWNPTHNL